MTVPATCGVCRHMCVERMDDGTDYTHCDGPRSCGATRAEEAPPPWCWLRALTPARPGRKPGPQGARTARLVVRVTPADLEAYQAAARSAGVSMGEWVRESLAFAQLAAESARYVPAAAEKEHGG